MKQILILIFAFLISMPILAQEENDVKISDVQIVSKETSVKVHSPRKATIMSAALPGLGQIYNKKYWKLPIVYAGIGGFGYFIYYNQVEFNQYKQAYIKRQNGENDQFNGILTNHGLINEMDRFRRYRDICALGFIAFYALQIIDANVDANLFDFDVSDDLSIQLKPVLIQDNFNNMPTGGVCCTIKF